MIGFKNRLERRYGQRHLHFITCSCYQRRPLLSSPHHRDLFLETLEEVRLRYDFVVFGYVVMPEHVHLLLSEPKHSDLSVVMQVLKQRVALKILRLLRASTGPAQSQLWKSPLSEGHVWQKRFYDFNVFTERKRVEKLRYMHRNPVERGLVPESAQWQWSSYRHYANGEPGPVLVNEPQLAGLKIRTVQPKATKSPLAS
jgi:putative transposase